MHFFVGVKFTADNWLPFALSLRGWCKKLHLCHLEGGAETYTASNCEVYATVSQQTASVFFAATLPNADRFFKNSSRD